MKKGIVILKEDLCIQWMDVLKKGGFDTLGLHFVVTENNLESYLHWVEENRELIEKFEKEGITVEHEIHAAGELMPKELFESHPDYFRMDESGKRNPDYNLCISNIEGLKCLEQSAYRLAARLAQKGHNYHIWADDKEVCCCCENCRKMSVSDQNLTLFHTMLKGIKRYDSKAKIAYLAYGNAFDPPTLPIGDDVFLEFAPMNRNLQHKITEPNAAEVTRRLDCLLDVFSAETAQILEYWFDESLYSGYNRNNVKKVPFNSVIFGHDINYYASKVGGAIKTFGAYIDKTYLETYGTEDIIAFGTLLQQAENQQGSERRIL